MTFIRNIRQKYFALLKIVDPERYVNELKKEGIA